MTVAPRRLPRWRSPVGLGLLVGLGGLFMVGALGGVVGFLAGAAAARRPQAVLVAAGVALLARPRCHRLRAAAERGRHLPLSRSTIDRRARREDRRACWCSPGSPASLRVEPRLQPGGCHPAPGVLTAPAENRSIPRVPASTSCGARSRPPRHVHALADRRPTVGSGGSRGGDHGARLAAVLDRRAAPVAGRTWARPDARAGGDHYRPQARTRPHAGRLRMAAGRHSRRFARELRLLAAGRPARSCR